MEEWLTTWVLTFGVCVYSFMYVWSVLRTSSSRPDRIVPPPGPKISRELQEELDQSPAWWDRQFHKLLETAPGQRVMGEEIIVEYDFHGNTSHYWPNQYLRDCVCLRCKENQFAAQRV